MARVTWEPPDETDTWHLLPPGVFAGLHRVPCCGRWLHNVRNASNAPADVTCPGSPPAAVAPAPRTRWQRIDDWLRATGIPG